MNRQIVRDIRIDFQSMPQLWMAYRGDGEHIELYGLGKTETAALAHLIEQELDAEDVTVPFIPSLAEIQDCDCNTSPHLKTCAIRR